MADAKTQRKAPAAKTATKTKAKAAGTAKKTTAKKTRREKSESDDGREKNDRPQSRTCEKSRRRPAKRA